MITDPIGDLITRLRNARVGDHSVEVKNSKANRAILKLLFAEGWINGWVSKKSAALREQQGNSSDNIGLLTVLMKDKAIDGSYGYGKNGGGRKSYDSSSIYGKLIGDIQRVSKPGRRVYVKQSELPAVTRDGLTTYVLSTPLGIITSVEARKLNVGGEVLFYVTT
jgi:small subunit ribosomal protein S8